MRQSFLYIFLFFMKNFIVGQNFEGKIIYYVQYQNLKTYKYDSTGTIGLGMTETFHIKNGDYLITGDGSKKEWVLYKSSTNKIYEKYKNNDTLFVIDAGKNKIASTLACAALEKHLTFLAFAD